MRLYDDGRVFVTKYEMKSLKPSEWLNAGVVGAWSSHLNFREMLRSPESPTRFFFTTYPTVLHSI